MKGLIAALLPLLAAASPVFTDTSIHHDTAPLLFSTTAEEIPNSYVVVFKDHVNHASACAHHSWVQDLHTKTEESRMELRKRSQIPLVDDLFSGLKHTYNIAGGLLGYSGHFDDAVVEEIRRHPDVRSSGPMTTI